MDEIRADHVTDSEVIIDAKSGKYEGIRSSRMRYYTLRSVAALTMIVVVSVSSWMGLIIGILYALGKLPCLCH